MSYKVVEDWASLSIGAGILPRSKISPENHSARPLLLDSGQPATITCEAVWSPNAVALEPVRILIDHLKTVGRHIVEGRAGWRTREPASSNKRALKSIG